MKAVIFDLDGCLVDSEPISLEALVAEMHASGLEEMTASDIRDRYLGVSLVQIHSDVKDILGTKSPSDFVERVEARIFAAYQQKLRRIDGVIELLQELEAACIQVAIATGSSERRLAKTLELSGLARYFHGTGCSADQVSNGKPAPDVFLFAADKVAVLPENCVVLEDSPHGIKGAVAAGMKAVGFVGGGHLVGYQDVHRTTLRQAGAVAVIDSLVDAYTTLIDKTSDATHTVV